jgi:hypothetical protein
MIGKLASTATHEIYVFPCDSHLIAISQDGICSMRVESGARLYARAFRELSTQHAMNSAFLNQDIQFEWVANPDAGRFEHFVLDLLNGNPEVRRARPRGHPNEPDAQSDLTADVYTSFLRNERKGSQEVELENNTVQLVVQCKTSIRNVGKAKVIMQFWSHVHSPRKSVLLTSGAVSGSLRLAARFLSQWRSGSCQSSSMRFAGQTRNDARRWISSMII